MGQLGFFDLDERYERLSETSDLDGSKNLVFGPLIFFLGLVGVDFRREVILGFH